jgi:hypothetical protein
VLLHNIPDQLPPTTVACVGSSIGCYAAISMEYLPIRERQCWPLQGFKRAGVHYQITVAMDTADPPLDELAELHRGGYRLKSWK